MVEVCRFTFGVAEIDKDGKQFENIARIYGATNDGESQLMLDVNCQLIQFLLNDFFELCLVETDSPSWDSSQLESWQASGWDYIMFGKVYSIESKANQTATLHASFGGLLMQLTSHGEGCPLRVGTSIYLQIRKM
jgi:hypothetical protein